MSGEAAADGVRRRPAHVGGPDAGLRRSMVAPLGGSLLSTRWVAVAIDERNARPSHSGNLTASAKDTREEGKRVAIVCQLDRYANGLRAFEVQRFLRGRGHDVRLVDTYYLSRASRRRGALLSKFPGLGFRRFALYATEAASTLLTRGWRFGRRHLSYYLLVADYRLRRSLLRSTLPLDDFDLVICETPYDAGVLTVPTSARKLYDCPTPWADEIYFEGRATESQHNKLRHLEKGVFEGVDHLAFHWESYGRYAVDHYGISGQNLMTLNFGCTPAARRAEFSDPPRVIYFGSLSSQFIDLPLLSRLARQYPHIDVYGEPPPARHLGLNYLGYAPPAVLQQYQLGLITCTQDELRRDGFSAKHLQYLAYGLPVLVPVWRRHLDLLRGSVVYDERTFSSVIGALSLEEEWRRLSDEAYAQAQRLRWDETLRPLEALLREQ